MQLTDSEPREPRFQADFSTQNFECKERAFFAHARAFEAASLCRTVSRPKNLFLLPACNYRRSVLSPADLLGAASAVANGPMAGFDHKSGGPALGEIHGTMAKANHFSRVGTLPESPVRSVVPRQLLVSPLHNETLLSLWFV